MHSPIAPSWSAPPTATAFIASLFAPAEHRDALYALYAFNVEIARVREVAREALPGEIRLQWWSEVSAGERGEEARANPVAAALLATIERYRLATDKLTDLIEAHRFDLYDDPMATGCRSRNLRQQNVLGADSLSLRKFLPAPTRKRSRRRQAIAFAHCRLLRALSAPCGAAPALCAGGASGRVISVRCTTYSPAVPRMVCRRRSPNYATWRAAISTRRMQQCRHCRRCDAGLSSGRAGAAVARSSGAQRSVLRPPTSRHGGGNG